MEVIRFCASSYIDEQTREHLRAVLDGELDWPYLVRTADTHGVVPLLYRGLREVESASVPDEVLKFLQQRCVRSAAYSTLLTETLLDLLRLLAEHNITAVPIKGPILAATAYEYPALRAFGDLDIMVRRKDVARTVELLTSAGYGPCSKTGRSEVLAELLDSRLRKDAGFVRSDGMVFVEVHWDFLPEARSFPLRPEYAWRSCQEVMLAGSKVPSFATEHVLMFLCAHGAKHGWMHLKWICDVAELARTQQNLDWDRAFLEARRLRSERLLRLGLQLAVDVVGAQLPPKAQSYIEGDRKAKALAQEVKERIISGRFYTERWEESLFWVRSREAARDRAQGILFYLFRSVLNPTTKDEAFVSLPQSLSFLYLLVRPVRLIMERRTAAADQEKSRASDTMTAIESEMV